MKPSCAKLLPWPARPLHAAKSPLVQFWWDRKAHLAEAKNEVEMRQDATAHAEMLVLRRAQEKLKGWRLTGTTLYVTKEPCPMCAGALAHVRVDRIVYGVADPKAGACGGAFNLFDLPGLNHRCSLTAGVLAPEGLQLLQNFFRLRRSQTP